MKGQVRESFMEEEVLHKVEVTEKSNQLRTEKRPAMLAIRRFQET